MLILGVDTGGTFTDFLLQDEQGDLRLHKVLSTPHAPEQAILQGMKDLGVDAAPALLIHGSTVATNAVLEAKGVSTVYITNRGLADVLAIGRQARRELYELMPEKLPPLIPPEHCLEVDARLSAEGEALSTLTDAELDALVSKIRGISPQAVSINLLFSFLDDTEERRIEAALEEAFGPHLFISRSSDVLPIYKEYERGVTTTLNAMVGPLMQQYLMRLQQSCSRAQITVMQSTAGTTTIDHAGRYPVHLLLSGPAGGLIGARAVADDDRLLTFDMGGTSTDVSIIDGEIGFAHHAEIAGYPIGVPMIDMHTIGAGGGSIARVDEAGLLLVGPESAGAAPGPACYGEGGRAATVTDANVVLGRLLPEAFLGGRMALDVSAAERAVQQIADALSVSLLEAAQGIIDVVDDHMVNALRVMSVQRGEDPAEYTLVSFGGAGGLHVCSLAESLGMSRAIVPVHAGVLSALGMLAADQVHERSISVNQLLSCLDQERIDNRLSELESTVENELQESESSDDIDIRREVDLRYDGQSHALTLEWDGGEKMEERFHARHAAAYGHDLDMRIELVNIRVRGAKRISSFELPAMCTSRADTTTRHVGEVRVVERSEIGQSDEIRGPALITEEASTTWLSAGWRATCDPKGNLKLEMEEE